MKKNLILLFVAICAFAACDPIHEDISNAGGITKDELMSKTSITVDKAQSGKNGNVITCQTLAAVNAMWDIGGKEFVGNYAQKKMKLGEHMVKLYALCADGTLLKDSVIINCEEVTNALEKFYIYGDVANYPDQVPFVPGAWDAAAMRFSSTEGAHLPTIPDEVYDGLKTLIFKVSDVTADFDLKVMNGWCSNTYYDHVKCVDGLNELQITDGMARECAKKYTNDDPAGGKDLDLMLYSGSMTLHEVYYEE